MENCKKLSSPDENDKEKECTYKSLSVTFTGVIAAIFDVTVKN